jgi:oxygen-independent coproporphyrinogen-3 oxidase
VRFAVAEGLDAFSEGTIGRLREVDCLGEREAALEDVVLGLRLAAGVEAWQARAAGALGALEEMERRGLLCRMGDRFRLDGRGWLLANEVFGAVWGLR